jgi:hypothetical protein
MKELLAFLILGGGFGYYVWSQRKEASTKPRCPTPAELDGYTGDVYAGKTSPEEADKMAASYDLAGCADAATSLRAAALAVRSAGGSSTTKAPGKGGPFGFELAHPDATKTITSTAPTFSALPMGGDPLAPENLPEPLRTSVLDLLNKAGPMWTYDDLVLASKLARMDGEVMKAWLSSGAYVPGKIVDYDKMGNPEYASTPARTKLEDHPGNAIARLSNAIDNARPSHPEWS